MARYLVMLRGDETAWDARDDDAQARNSARHAELARVAPSRGHVIVGGEELTHSTSALVVRRAADGGRTVSEGPYGEVVEQVGGYYVVETDDVADLAALVAEVLDEDAEIRGFVDHAAAAPADPAQPVAATP
ncbi:YciI family protein [Cellulomonas fimi]|uniref:YCII-related protein n=1 Tax=Cellulomonas fimi (strain ATCC 484 / DSM 20113 / JCM 1341 / CCUG 24087 / LMG 16345 / NBRC 15513 / NCIMB 8980 / NCTC 7547 / NRS-133) TaxID=590998 RepID=F4H150_CELFA|nr:YciI family protein [Cellulomonas fimi]AEE47419.1 YCII-related protein [Cellulomonas fimi ATCC 484]NNH05753.1 hypothetical protein [Cellulomonas fimi]VEH36163.1 Uncharacterized protein conserved in bacteria [Cellulomonas fimi]